MILAKLIVFNCLGSIQYPQGIWKQPFMQNLGAKEFIMGDSKIENFWTCESLYKVTNFARGSGMIFPSYNLCTITSLKKYITLDDLWEQNHQYFDKINNHSI